MIIDSTEQPADYGVGLLIDHGRRWVISATRKKGENWILVDQEEPWAFLFRSPNPKTWKEVGVWTVVQIRDATVFVRAGPRIIITNQVWGTYEHKHSSTICVTWNTGEWD